MTSLDQILDTIEELPLNQKEMLLEILHRRHAEELRRQIARDAKESLALLDAGKLRPQSAEEVIAHLRQSLSD